MIKEIVDNWEQNKSKIREELESNLHPGDYMDLVKVVLKHVGKINDYTEMDVDRIHLIDDGDYQGTLVFVIGATGYQPSTYWYVKVYYGSCSGCDTLEGIRGFSYRDSKPSEEQVNDYMTLALHIVQGIKQMGDE